MSVQIDERCVACGACIWECPTEAITPGVPRPVVTQASCTECYGFFGESQCIVVCPVDAISVTVETLDQLGERFASMYPDRELQDTWIWRRLGRHKH